MLFDFNEAWPRVSEARYDVCVCGSGPAGITAARKLASYGKKVVLLEAGGLAFSERPQDCYKGKNIGNPFWWIETGRLRYFGGTSNHWGGLCVMFDPVSFGTFDHNGLPGWPISHAEAVENLEEAQEILDVPGKYLGRMKFPGFESPLFDQFTHANSLPTRFNEKYGGELRRSEQIDTFYNANVTDIRLSDDLSGVKHLRVQNYNGQNVEVAVGTYVVAFGGLENPRILLNANSQVPHGIGNQHGMVGRCFMESLNVPAGRFLITDPDFWTQHNDVPLVPTEELLRKKDVGTGVIDFTANISAGVIKYGGRLGPLKDFLVETGCQWPNVRDLARKIVDFHCPGDGIITTMIEQEPNPKSRVSLTDDVDEFGLRRIQFDWQFTERDFKTIRTLVIEAAKEMARLDRARVQLAPAVLDPQFQFRYVHGHGHHMGTTRMSADPRHGVVDRNCRVHGIRNLYVIGCSTFAKCGGRNPTLTVVSLALRLGHFLGRQS
jgi:choline dehydrogenase-like flavoprotein